MLIEMPKNTGERRLIDLRSVGPATMDDFELLGVSSVQELADCNAQELFDRLCELRGEPLDRCCEDVFACAIAQARDPELPRDQCDWWFWSAERKRREDI